MEMELETSLVQNTVFSYLKKQKKKKKNCFQK